MAVKGLFPLAKSHGWVYRLGLYNAWRESFAINGSAFCRLLICGMQVVHQIKVRKNGKQATKLGLPPSFRLVQPNNSDLKVKLQSV